MKQIHGEDPEPKRSPNLVSRNFLERFGLCVLGLVQRSPRSVVNPLYDAIKKWKKSTVGGERSSSLWQHPIYKSCRACCFQQFNHTCWSSDL